MQKFYVKILEQYEELEGLHIQTKSKTLGSYRIQQKDIIEIEKFLNSLSLYKLTPQRKKAVRCIETNMIFDCKASAGSWLKKHNFVKFSINAENNIRAVCNGKKDKAYGFHWEYVNE